MHPIPGNPTPENATLGSPAAAASEPPNPEAPPAESPLLRLIDANLRLRRDGPLPAILDEIADLLDALAKLGSIEDAARMTTLGRVPTLLSYEGYLNAPRAFADWVTRLRARGTGSGP